MITLLENRDEAPAKARIPETGWRLWPFPRDHCCCSVGRMLVPGRQRECSKPHFISNLHRLSRARKVRRTNRCGRVLAPRLHRLSPAAAAAAAAAGANRGARKAQARPRRPPPATTFHRTSPRPSISPAPSSRHSPGIPPIRSR
ncbi:hypothetical protein M433DRAFT_200752 [Acidomyces richmondensis BFW]|nr:MAG: hypothetical protein FE78DRAFT_351745 [Acidomyces sp. 'richmondensis']KYG46447.1 hypothetical protein M433DRAFT_200752 [Acidomyces richmondensis BFW]